MIKRMMTVAALMAMGAAASAYDASAVLRAARESANKQPNIDGVRAAMDIRVEPGCTKVTFETGAPAISAPIWLQARTWIEECRPIGMPGGGCIPERRLMRTEEETVTVEVEGRAATDPQEKFSVCYYGMQGLSGSVRSSPFKYHRANSRTERLTFRRKS